MPLLNTKHIKLFSETNISELFGISRFKYNMNHLLFV